MPQKTPLLHAKGTYTVLSPFTLVSGAVYECIAIRSFVDLIKEGIDVFDRYYAPHSIDLADFNNDKALGINIITLASPNQPTIYIPDSYISAVPSLDTVAYSNVVLSISLGAVPDALDLSFLLTQLSETCSDVIGISPTVNKFVAPSTGVVTASEHAVTEAARNAAITNRTTDRAKVLSLQNQLAEVTDKLAGLQAYVIENDGP